MKPLWRGRKKRAGQGREGQGKFRVAMGFIRNHPIHTLERHVSVSANLLSLISGISHIPHSLQRFAIAIESIPTIMKDGKCTMVDMYALFLLHNLNALVNPSSISYH